MLSISSLGHCFLLPDIEINDVKRVRLRSRRGGHFRWILHTLAIDFQVYNVPLVLKVLFSRVPLELVRLLIRHMAS